MSGAVPPNKRTLAEEMCLQGQPEKSPSRDTAETQQACGGLVAAQFPSRSDGNPYVNLLKAALGRAGVNAVEHNMYIGGRGRLPVRLDPGWLDAHQGQVQILHFHWLQKFYRGTGPQETQERLALLSEFLTRARRLGYVLAYTFHNLLPHEGAGADIDTYVRRLMIENAGVITCFSERQRAQIEKRFGGLERLRIITHPGYVGYYPDTITQEESRRRLDIPLRARVLAFMGLIRPYKELPALLSAFRAFRHKEIYLVIAGSTLDAQKDAALAAELTAEERIRAHIRWIEEEEIQVYMRAADIVVLPNRECWSSGVLMTAFSFGKTVLAADPLMLDAPEDLGLFHDGRDLPAALKVAAEAPAETLQAIGARGQAYATAQTWDQAGRRYAELYRGAYAAGGS